MGESTFRINGRGVGAGFPVFIVGEVGINHNGEPRLAEKMIEEAIDSGVDAVKVQIVDPEKSYQKGTESYQIFKKVYMPFDEWRHIVSFAKERGMTIFSSVGSLRALEIVQELSLPAIKISSGN